MRLACLTRSRLRAVAPGRRSAVARSAASRSLQAASARALPVRPPRRSSGTREDSAAGAGSSLSVRPISLRPLVHAHSTSAAAPPSLWSQYSSRTSVRTAYTSCR